MIAITYSRFPDGTLRHFTALGHAEHGEIGKDIVCAGVTALFLATAETLSGLLGGELNTTSHPGCLFLQLPESVPDFLPSTVWQIRAAGEVLLTGCRQIETIYGRRFLHSEESDY